ncbi:GntR family transcriptional regulator [Caballeronia sp. DA-9]|uniref:GntR family transcriptional regulator n=1 Tax=Caballeronia sp. DA-9 TaxID=3436237 RepID=UPI003F665D29
MKRQKLQLASGDAEILSVDLKEFMADTLRRRILSMELAPSAVVDEGALSEEFGLSRPPVRELMRQMAAEGYLELEQNRPARVSPMSYQALRSFCQAAPVIYVATTQLAAINATAQDIQRLKDIQANFREAIEQKDVQSRVLFNDQFHHEIGKIANNTYLMPSLRRVLLDHARLGMIFYRTPSPGQIIDDVEETVNQHDEIIAAIAARDLEAAGDIVRRHMDQSRKHMSEYVVPDSLNVPIQI